jgi:hypothetical protein
MMRPLDSPNNLSISHISDPEASTSEEKDSVNLNTSEKNMDSLNRNTSFYSWQKES